MKPRRKTKFTDEKTEGNALSKKRNQATQRLIQQIKDHQFITGFKVKVQFKHTWARGKSYTWTSPNWSSATENDEPEPADPIIAQQINAESEVNSESEVPNSQEISRKPKAQAGSSEEKEEMRKPKCAKCFQTKNSSLDPHPGGIWLSCGYLRCTKLQVHAACSSVNLPKQLRGDGVQKFCKDFIRCNEHFGKQAPSQFTGFESGSEDEDPFGASGANSDESDSDFSTSMVSIKAPKTSARKRSAPSCPQSSTFKASAPKAFLKKASAPKSAVPNDSKTDSGPKLKCKPVKTKPKTNVVDKIRDKSKEFNVSEDEYKDQSESDDQGDFQAQCKMKKNTVFSIGDKEFD